MNTKLHAVTDTHGRFIHVNRGLSELLERPANQVLGQTVAEVFGPGFPGSVAERHAACIQGQAPDDPEEWERTRADGSRRWLAVRWQSFIPKDSPNFCILTVTDITARKEREAQRVRQEIQALREQKWESLGLMASGIAHRFNNLLTTIMGYADLARLPGG